ncbi:NAD_binding_11 domain-containing protein [Psidium guajava]|nr:NAD_binding_11 domain-containing protein [Psidium guajava]
MVILLSNDSSGIGAALLVGLSLKIPRDGVTLEFLRLT